MNLSIHTRLFFAASITLAFFLGLTGIVLDKAFKESALASLQDRLQAQIYGLLAASDLDENNVMKIPDTLPDPRFSVVDSGLYANVHHINGQQQWLSQSALGRKIIYPSSPQVGQQLFERLDGNDGDIVYSLSYGIAWEDSRGELQHYVFRVSEDIQVLNKQINRFRDSLWKWLVGVAVILLLVQAAILHWSLIPLRRVERNLADIQAGHSKRLYGQYPREINGLTNNLNLLLENAQLRLQRYRDSLGNLAHSLKTPLAVLRGLAEETNKSIQWRSTALEQISIMNDIVDYQLRRAATFGKNNLSAPIAVSQVVEKVIAALSKVYIDKEVDIEISLNRDIKFYGDIGDLYEVIGNVTDNAYKWCRKKVSILLIKDNDNSENNSGLKIIIEDDGPGIANEKRGLVLQRGHRADQSTDGQGIGLTVVAEIVDLYDGQLIIKDSPLGGAKIILAFT